MKKENTLAALEKFFKSLTTRNLLNDIKIFIAYVETIHKIKFNEDIIYSVKELSHKKDRVNLAFKRLIAMGNTSQDDDWYYKNLPILEKYFPTIANFQNKKNKSSAVFAKSDLKDAQTWSLELYKINEFIKFMREHYFKKRTKK